QAAGHRDLDVDRLVEAAREEVVVVGGRRAPGQEQLGQRDGGGELEVARGEPGPHRVEAGEPGEELDAGDRPPGAGERLVEVVVGVDQPGDDDVLARVDDLVARRGRLSTGGQQLHHPVPPDDDPATGVLAVGGEHGERAADPRAAAHRPPPRSSRCSPAGPWRRSSGRAPSPVRIGTSAPLASTSLPSRTQSPSSSASSTTGLTYRAPRAASTDGCAGVPTRRWLNSRLSTTAMTAAEEMPEWKIVVNQSGNAS